MQLALLPQCVSVEVNAHWLIGSQKVYYDRHRIELEAPFYADPHSFPKRITGFVALSAHPDGIQGRCDGPEQALQLL